MQKQHDSHPRLPLDPDPEQLKTARPIHMNPPHITLVAVGAFCGTLLRYEIGLWLPSTRGEWPLAILIVNLTGAFLLGALLQALLQQGKDEGVRRTLRLGLGTGFLGSFTTYSSLAAGAAMLAHDSAPAIACLYALASVLLGVLFAAFGIRTATVCHTQQREPEQ